MDIDEIFWRELGAWSDEELVRVWWRLALFCGFAGFVTLSNMA